MKKVIFLFIFLLIAVYSKSQDTSVQPVKEPEYFFEPAFIDSNNIQHPLLNEKVKTLTYQQVFKTSLYLIIDSVQATFSIKENQKIRMIVKCNPLTFAGNPKDYFRLYQLTVNRKTKDRRCLLVSNKSFVNSVTNYNPGLPINFTKVSDNTYILSFENLKQGEYALLVSRTMYSFSVI